MDQYWQLAGQRAAAQTVFILLRTTGIFLGYWALAWTFNLPEIAWWQICFFLMGTTSLFRFLKSIYAAHPQITPPKVAKSKEEA